MHSSLIFADLAAGRQRDLIAAADAHRIARLARPTRLRRRARAPETLTPASWCGASCETVPTR
jgi:hypothetical protein